MIHSYSNNGLPQIRIGFPNGWTVSVVVAGDGTAALAHWPTPNEDRVNPKKFSDADRARYASMVVLGNQEATPTELMLYLQTVEALPEPENEDDKSP